MEFQARRLFLFIVAILGPVNSLFVPEQLPTLLSFIYTNIPPIRKGIDSRVGFGFRLGPNADVQVMLELGPQQNTAPLGPQKADGNSKRETRLPPYKYRAPVKGSWLHAWKQQQAYSDNGEDVGVLPAQPAMDSDVVAHLQQLYKEQPTDSARSAKELKHQANRLNGDRLTHNPQEQEPTGTDEPGQVQNESSAEISEVTTRKYEVPLVNNDQINNVPT